MSARRWIRRGLRKGLLTGMPPDWLINHSRRMYVTQAVLATPPWIAHGAFKALDARTAELTLKTGIPHTQDHIVPLNHPRVCGLNVPWNIQILTKAENAAKGNSWVDEDDGWFNQPEQLRLFNEYREVC